MIEILTKHKKQILLFFFSTAIGGLFFVSILGTKIIDPTFIAWLMNGTDWAQHFLGWHFFKNEAWHFPVGKLTSILHPVGATIGYTDSIPVMALFFKPFASILPDNFQYFGLWLLFCLFLQGLFGALLIRILSNNLIIQLLGAAFFVISPILLARIGHPALCAQWLLLVALWLYLRNWKRFSTVIHLGSWSIIIILSAAIHPFLNVMIIGLAFAFYLRFFIVDQVIHYKHGILCFSILLVLTSFVWWTIGYLEIGNIGRSYGSFGYGFFSMNLAAPINPVGWSGGMWSGSFSTFMKSWPAATKGQAEGFNYLGIGVIILGLWVLYEALRRPPKLKTIKPLLPLAIICVCFTLLAVSNKITFNNHVIMEVPLSQNMLSALSPFRSSGRFFWPVYYFILFLIIAFLIRRNNSKVLIPLMLIGLTLQVIDFHNMYAAFARVRYPKKEWNNPLKSKIWTDVGKHYEKIVIVPPRGCVEQAAAPYKPFAYLAANHGMSINSFYLARYNYYASNNYCDRLISNIKNGVITSDSVYILNNKYLNILQRTAKVPLVYASVDGFTICVSDQGNKSNPVIKSMKEIAASQLELHSQYY